MENKINGNTQGIRDSVLDAMLGIYDIRMTADEFVNSLLLDTIAEYSSMLSREVSVYISRGGQVVDVSVGDSSNVSMPSMRLVRNTDRLCGVRCIHTHPNGDPRLSGVDLGTLRGCLLDSMVAVAVRDGKPLALSAAFISEVGEDGEKTICVYGPLRPYKLPNALLLNEITLADNRLRASAKDNTDEYQEKVILVGMDSETDTGYDSLDELGELALTAGAKIVGQFTQRKRPADNATYIGSGKADELAKVVHEKNCDLLIFDDELSATQVKNLERITGARVIDRTLLILDIFALRATSKEGKLQVELARQKYRLPRLIGQGTELSRLGGGGGGIGARRGQGETKLEIDKRRIRRRIFELEEELAEVEKQRQLRRSKRDKGAIPLVALVGYTNAGKSTLINTLSGSQEYVCDQLFATLDPVVRKITLPKGLEILMSDTVGFINKLPHELISAFRSTLDEVCEADIILHVVDASSESCQKQICVVEEVLSELNAINIPQILVRNKCDRDTAFTSVQSMAKSAVNISALNSTGVTELLATIENQLIESKNCIELTVPYSKYEVLAYIRANGTLLEESHGEDGTRVKALLDASTAGKVNSMLETVTE